MDAHSGEHLSDSQALILLKSLEPKPELATRQQQWICAIPMFLLFIFLAVASFLTSLHENIMRQFSAAGTATFCTDILLLWHGFMSERPFVFPTAMFLFSWFYFGVWGRTPRRLWWFSRATALLAFLWFFIAVLGLVLPQARFEMLR
ncbi:MAG TPA: hypothetical protein VEJ63_18140 [Planctomycetota bacterium]|nr:hypothetical protein [Planctomycetota bacterium]